MTELKEITHAEFKELRLKQYIKQKRVCPILRRKIKFRDSVLDHKHKTKSETLGEDGKGLIRGIIHNQANVFEGKIVKLYKRYGLHKFISLVELLRNVADYIEFPPMKPEYVHPNERPKPKRLGKRDFNRICKYYFQMYPTRMKLPVYPKMGRTNAEFEKMIKMANELYEKDKKPKKEKLKLRGKNG